ncbi:MAG TPA: DNA alkylation repair protein [Vicinamibacterales bacterium]|nr:DNA alkylation repair protein [Vicinamibacterales bacterium]
MPRAEATVTAIVAWLEKNGSRKSAANLARYGLPTDNAYGISVASLRTYANRIGKDHDLAMELWKTGSLDARILASFLADPEQLTLSQMNAWCRDFDNWGTTDTACFTLFDRTPLGWKVVGPWIKRTGEFQRRAGFVMIACLAAHDKTATDAAFMKFLPMIEKGAADERNFVKKGVSWALRHLGHRSVALHAAAIRMATKLSKSQNAAERWVGKDALRDITRPAVINKVRSKAR